MAKFIIVLCALVACATAKPGLVAPLAYSAPLLAAAHTPFAYSTHLAYAAAPLAYANAHLDAAHASSRIDIRHNYHAAVVPTTLAAIAPAAPVATPLKYTAAAPLALPSTPLAYANAYLDAAYASSRVDIKQNYNAVPTTFAAVAPVATAPLKYTAPAPLALAATPLAYANAHLDATHASSRTDIRQNYNAAVVPTTLAAAAPVAAVAPVATQLKYTAAAPLALAATPLAYANAHLDAAYASNRVDIKQNYNAAVLPTTFAAVAPVATAPLKYTAPAPALL